MSTPVLVIHAHPYPDRSIAGRALLASVQTLSGVTVHSLYERYPDFSIDVSAERAALHAAQLVVWMHPLYWYSAPALMKLWFERVLGPGWAYGDGGHALAGKQCLWAVSTGASAAAYAADGEHGFAFTAFEPVMQQTARFCQMQWLPPFVVHGAHRLSPAALQAHADALRQRVLASLPGIVPGIGSDIAPATVPAAPAAMASAAAAPIVALAHAAAAPQKG